MSDDVEPQAEPPPEGYKVLPWTRGFGRQVGPMFYRRGEDGRRTFGLRVDERHLNGLSNAHGGLLMTLADVAWGNIITVERNAYWVTVRLTCDFLASAKPGEWVEAGSEILSEEGDLFSVRGKVWCGERLVLTGTGLFKSMGPRPPRQGFPESDRAKAAVA